MTCPFTIKAEPQRERSATFRTPLTETASFSAGHTNGIVALAVSAASQELLSVGLDDMFRRTPLPAEQYAEAPGPVSLGGQPSDLDVAGDLAIVATANGIVLLREGKVRSK